MKFLLDETQAGVVESLLKPRLTLDPHADPSLAGAYRTTTLYCDTPAGDVFRRIGPHKRRKYRLRRYGGDAAVFLERKTKQGERVRKRRATIPDDALPRLQQPPAADDWPGLWFHEQTARRGLLPALRVSYVRTAWFGATTEGPIRVTFDRDVRGLPTAQWNVSPFAGGVSILAGQVICEFKFHGALPASLRSVIAALRLLPRGVSKYRLCAEAAGLAEGHHA